MPKLHLSLSLGTSAAARPALAFFWKRALFPALPQPDQAGEASSLDSGAFAGQAFGCSLRTPSVTPAGGCASCACAEPPRNRRTVGSRIGCLIFFRLPLERNCIASDGTRWRGDRFD